MMLVRRSLCLLLAGLFIAACAPSARPTDTGPSVEQLAATIAAATINAGMTAAAAASPTPAAPSPTATVQPTLFINAATANCRSGPGPDYQVIASLVAGTTVDLVAKDSSDGYWIVLDPASHSQCWMSVQDATPSGSFDLLPEVTAQPITVAVPAKPGAAGRPDFACDNTTLTTILYWVAPPGPVNGYRIYRKGVQIADVPADQNRYTEKIPFVFGSSVEYSVAAYNDAGLSPQRTWDVHCP